MEYIATFFHSFFISVQSAMPNETGDVIAKA